MRITKTNGKSVRLDFIPPGAPPAPVEIEIGNFVFGEVPSGAVNGSNASFTTEFNFIPETLEVFNPVRLNVIDDYVTIGANVIQFTFSPAAGEKIKVNYIKA